MIFLAHFRESPGNVNCRSATLFEPTGRRAQQTDGAAIGGLGGWRPDVEVAVARVLVLLGRGGEAVRRKSAAAAVGAYGSCFAPVTEQARLQGGSVYKVAVSAGSGVASSGVAGSG